MVIGGGSRDSVVRKLFVVAFCCILYVLFYSPSFQDGLTIIFNFGDINILDLETLCWVPLNYTDLHLRNGCKALTYYEGPLPGAVNNNSNTAVSTPSSAVGNSDLEAGWIFSGIALTVSVIIV
jgi:hypothetical protein